MKRRDFLATALAVPFAQAADAYRWGNVALGGGGYVTGIAIHPREPDNIWIRTDVGGPYRLNARTGAWEAVFDFVTEAERNLVGADSLALDPNDSDVVWVAAGSYDYATPSDILRSADRGRTWTRSQLNVRMGGNQSGRTNGERLAVHPLDGRRAYFGSRYDGLFRTDDAGRNWYPLASLEPKGNAGNGIAFVQFGDPGALYAGVTGVGVFLSNDGGDSWNAIPGGPDFSRVNPRRAAIDAAGMLYLGCRAASGTNGGVWKYDGVAWRDITPEAGRNFGAVAAHPIDAGVALAAESRDGFNCRLYLTRDGGGSWKQVAAQPQPDVPWWPAAWWASAVSCLAWDPHRPSRVWYTDWYGTWHTEDFAAEPSVWRTRERGHETVVVFDLCPLPIGPPLLTGAADVDGVRHDDLAVFPTRRFTPPEMQDTASLDFCETQPAFVVRVGGRRSGTVNRSGAWSDDAGAKWHEFESLPVAGAQNGRVAVAADDPDHMVWVPMGGIPYVTADRGRTWTPSSGAPTGAITGSQIWAWNQPLAGDRVEGFRFWLYRSGVVYVSDDGGLNWRPTASLANNGNQMVKCPPGRANEVWISLDTSGLWKWEPLEVRFVRVAGVDRAAQFGFGKGLRADLPAVYVRGRRGTVEGMFRSDDLGTTWLDISSKDFGFATANTLEGDRQVHGRVYVGTNGRGVFVGEPMG